MDRTIRRRFLLLDKRAQSDEKYDTPERSYNSVQRERLEACRQGRHDRLENGNKLVTAIERQGVGNGVALGAVHVSLPGETELEGDCGWEQFHQQDACQEGDGVSAPVLGDR